MIFESSNLKQRPIARKRVLESWRLPQLIMLFMARKMCFIRRKLGGSYFEENFRQSMRNIRVRKPGRMRRSLR